MEHSIDLVAFEKVIPKNNLFLRKKVNNLLSINNLR